MKKPPHLNHDKPPDIIENTAYCQSLLQHNPFQTRRPDRADVKETLNKDHGGLKSERTDKHPAGSSSDTEDSLLSDETPKSDFHMKEITNVLVERPGQDEIDDPAEEQLSNSLSKDRD